jgi:hypothetical protein
VVDDLYRFLGDTNDRKPATVLRLHTLLRAAFAQAVRWGWADRNPVDRASPPRVHRDEIKPPPINDDVLRLLERATASHNPEMRWSFGCWPPPGAGEVRFAPSSGTTST